MDSLTLTRDERLRRCSIDCADAVTWTHWSVGGEYSRKLVLKNTHDKLQVIEYKLPQRKATFFVDFPAPVSLSSGMAFELEIKFRPSELVEFHDGIEISVRGRGSFRIALDALTPFARLKVPDHHDFEFCAVGATSSVPLPIMNSGTVPLDFYWELPEPFELQPRMGSLAEGESMQVQVAFTPTEATSMLCRAVCKRAGSHEVLSCLKLSGIGKYAFVSFHGNTVTSAPEIKDANKASTSKSGSQSSTTMLLDFGNVLTKSTATRLVTVRNSSCVDAQFHLKRTDKDIVCPFTITPSKGVIPRDGTVQFHVRYSPAGSGANAANDFACQTVGGNTITLRCRGTSTGPTAALSTTKLEFGDIDIDLLTDSHAPSKAVAELKAKLDRFVTLRNTTDAPIHFQFVGTSPGAAFSVSPCSGQITSRGTENVKVSFHPALPMNYLRRLFVLVNDTENALFVDVLGTGFNSKSRPAPFTAADARAFFARQEVGLGRCTPDDLAKLADAIREDEPVASEDDAAAREAMRYVQQERLINLAGTTSNKPIASTSKKSKTIPHRSATSLGKILPSEEAVASAPFALDRSQLLFRGFASEGELVAVRNNTSAKATASWSVPEGAPWTVTPETLDVPPFSSATFRVRVSGSVPNSSFGCFLECYVNFKQMRSFRLVSEDTFCPPHCLLLQCQRLVSLGETASAPFVDAPSQVAFPPCKEDESVLQVVSMVNKSDTVAAFSIQVEAQVVGGLSLVSRAPAEGVHIDPEEDELAQRQALSSVFTCFPSSGVIPPKETMLLLLKFNPPKNARFVGVAKVQINDSPQAAKHIALRGEGFVPKIEVDGNGVILFRPTSVGGSTQRTYVLRNPSRIPVVYDIQVQQPLLTLGASKSSLGGTKSASPLFEIEPKSGIIDGFGSVSVRCTFAPPAAKRFEAKVMITAEAINSPTGSLSADSTTTEPPKSQLLCQAVGEGMIGVVSVEPSSLSFGHILVGESKSQQMAIFNSSLCDLQYEVRWVAKGDAAHASHNDSALLPAAAPEFINGRGVIRARSHVNVHVCLQPVRGSFEYILYVIVGGGENIYLSPEPSLSDVTRLPHCIASVVGASPSLQFTDVRSVLQPKSQLWRQLSLSAVNAELKADITPVDANKTAFSFDQAMEGLKPLHCDLGVDVFRTTPIKIMARLDNIGTCGASFRVWLPDESEIPSEPWHQTKLYSNDVAEVLDAGLFDVFPREGVIPAGGHLVLNVTYRHTRVGAHQLPVILMLEQGKRVLLVLSARTLEENVPYLYFHHSREHTLSAVAVGDLEPPLQYTELQNLSHRSIQYTVDENVLAELREANYDFPILQCLNPQGMIPPMSTMLLSWYFRPLEVKHYEALIRIETEDLGNENGGVEGSGDTSSYTIKLLGDGYHPKKVTPLQIRSMHGRDFLEVPKFPALQHPLLPVRLSMDVLRYGSIPFHSLHRQVVSIKNHHPSDAFLFEWHCVLQYGDQIFDIDPPRGRLAPGESATCRITLYSGSTSHIIDNPIHCHVLNDDLRKRRQTRRDQVEREAAMELDDDDDQGSGNNANSKRGTKLGRPRIRQAVTTVPAKFQNTKRLREAIQSITEAVVAEDVDENSDDLIYVEVLPTVLELLVQARMMPMDSFRETYGETAGKNFFYPTLSAFRTTVPPNSVDLHDASQNEWALVHDILEDMMKEVVHHADILDAFADCSEDPVPYFLEMIATDGDAEEDRTNASSPTSRPVTQFFPTGNNDSGAADGEEDEDDKENKPMLPPSGDLQCLIEEVLEGAIYGIVQEAHKEGGVVAGAAFRNNNRAIRQL